MNSPTDAEPTADDIRTRAYHLWEGAGRPDGRDAEFWDAAAHQLRPVEVVALAADATGFAPLAPLNAILAHMIEQQHLPPADALQLTEGQVVLIGDWELKLDRPGADMPTVRRFYPMTPEVSIDPAFNALVDARPDAAEQDELNATAEQHRTDVRLAQVQEECRLDSEKIQRSLERRRAARRSVNALSHAVPRNSIPEPIPEPEPAHLARCRELIDPADWTDFCRFCRDGTASPTFLARLDRDDDYKEAAGLVIDALAESLRTFLREVKADEYRATFTDPTPAPEPPPDPVSWAWRNTGCRCGLHRWGGSGGTYCQFCLKPRH